MSLHTDTVDGYTLGLHLLHHVVDAVALVRIDGAVVVVEQQGLRVSLTGILESLLDELVTAETVHGALTIGVSGVGIVADGLVHHIPAVNDILVTGDDRLDMILHTGIELLLGGTLGSHPTANL